jgi:xanthine dehydrogenase accessory factor
MSPGPEVWVFGAGHVGLAVGELAAFTGFRVTLVDDRPEYADEKRAPWAHSMMACDFVDAASKAPGGADSYVVIVTRGHAWDAQVLYEILRLEPRPYYVGMMGSKPKVKSCFDGLRAKGVSEEALAVVHAPIGLAIGGDSPREIAVSVVAEMVAARNGRDPKCLQGGAGYGGASNA